MKKAIFAALALIFAVVVLGCSSDDPTIYDLSRIVINGIPTDDENAPRFILVSVTPDTNPITAIAAGLAVRDGEIPIFRGGQPVGTIAAPEITESVATYLHQGLAVVLTQTQNSAVGTPYPSELPERVERSITSGNVYASFTTSDNPAAMPTIRRTWFNVDFSRISGGTLTLNWADGSN